MTTDTLWLAAVLFFFGSFAVTHFTVYVWCNLPERPKSPPKAVPARRPASLAETILDPRLG